MNNHGPVIDPEQELDDVLVACLDAEPTSSRDRQALLARYPGFASELERFFAQCDGLERLAAPLREAMRSAAGNKRDSAFEEVNDPLQHLPRSFAGYELLGLLGEGGMSTVYKARQTSLNRLVALKMIRADRLISTPEVRHFRVEAELVALLDHPNIVPIHEVGECDGLLYLSLKFIEGGSLAERLPRADGAAANCHPVLNADPHRRVPNRQAITDPREAAHLMVDVARAVHHAHQCGILHRDLKPSNILLDDKGRPHVADFGLAKRVAVDSSLTQSGQLVGTPSYMAPEQAAGKSEPLTTVADVYGLGAVLYALINRPAPVSGGLGLGDAPASQGIRARASHDHQSQRAARPGDDLPQVLAQGTVGALRLRRGVGG